MTPTDTLRYYGCHVGYGAHSTTLTSCSTVWVFCALEFNVQRTPTVAQLAALLLLLLTTKRPLAALMGSSSSAVQWQGTRELTTVLVCSTANVTAAAQL
jgi:hypothetical protein